MRQYKFRSRLCRAFAATLVLVLVGCPEPSEQGEDKCLTMYDPDFPTNGSVNILKATNCPFSTTEALWVPFSATATFNLPSTVISNYYEVLVTDRNGQTTQKTVQKEWGSTSDTRYLQVNGQYYAANGGFSNGKGFDTWEHEFQIQLSGGGTDYSSAYSKLPYKYGPPGAQAGGPANGIAPGGTFQVVGNTDDPLMIGAVTWDFYLDGTLMASGSTPYYQFTAGAAGTEHQVDVRVTDINGRTHVGYAYVLVCQNGQFEC